MSPTLWRASGGGNGTVSRAAGGAANQGRPSISWPSGPLLGEVKAPRLVAWVLRTRAAAWIWSASTTMTPRPHACGASAVRMAASRLAGPSCPAWVGFRMAPVTTSGCGPPCHRSSRYAVSSIESVPWVTTAPSAPAA